MAGDEPDSSLSVRVSDLKQWSTILHSHHRPLITHLNADTTWLIQLPYPASVTPPPGRTHFNIVLDPWLQGPQSDVAAWFSTQWHVVPPSVATIDDLNSALRYVEGQGIASAAHQSSFVDVVAISHEFTDHCHRATLEELPRETPVFASDVAAELIKSWKHFDKVITTPALGSGVHWSRLTVGSLPEWVAIGRVITPGNALYYHSAILIAFNIKHRPKQDDSTAEAVIYSPHGIQSQDLTEVKSSDIKTLALLHGMDDVRIWMTKQLNLGALNGIKAVGVSGAKYWIATHDEVKKGGGFIAPLLQRVSYTLKEAVTYEHEQLHQAGVAPSYHFLELGSGDGMVLE